MSVTRRILFVVGALAAVAVAVVILAIQALSADRELAREGDELAMQAVLSERTNGLVYAVVMESRGIYMSADAAKIRKYGDSLLAQATALEDTVREWGELQPDRAQLGPRVHPRRRARRARPGAARAGRRVPARGARLIAA